MPPISSPIRTLGRAGCWWPSNTPAPSDPSYSLTRRCGSPRRQPASIAGRRASASTPMRSSPSSTRKGVELAMRLGAALPITAEDGGPPARHDFAAGAAMLEDVGYTSVWVFDAIGRGFMLPDPLIALAVAATVTER